MMVTMHNQVFLPLIVLDIGMFRIRKQTGKLQLTFEEFCTGPEC